MHAFQHEEIESSNAMKAEAIEREQVRDSNSGHPLLSSPAN